MPMEWLAHRARAQLKLILNKWHNRPLSKLSFCRFWGSFEPTFRIFLQGLYRLCILPLQKESKIGQNNPQNRRSLSFERGSLIAHKGVSPLFLLFLLSLSRRLRSVSAAKRRNDFFHYISLQLLYENNSMVLFGVFLWRTMFGFSAPLCLPIKIGKTMSNTASKSQPLFVFAYFLGLFLTKIQILYLLKNRIFFRF